jgi:hypothetical protein
MSVILGVPAIKGKSEVIFNYGFPSTNIQPGLAVKRTATETAAIYDGSGTIFGVSAYANVKNSTRFAVVERGKSIGVLLETPGESITVGSQVYVVDATGKFTSISGEGKTATAATFASAADDAVNLKNGEATDAAAASTTATIPAGAAYIDALGGF